jgi:hypothetical protein
MTAAELKTILQTSTSYRARTERALAETIELLQTELGYKEHLQDQAKVSFYTAHIALLTDALN